MEETVIEEVAEIRYLEYMVRRNGGDEGQIKDIKKKTNIVMRQVWELGERRFKDDFRRRMVLYRYLVLEVMMYKVKIWGWREREELKKSKRNILSRHLALTPVHRTISFIKKWS